MYALTLFWWDCWEAAHHDIVEIGLDMSLSEIQTMSKDAFKTKVKKHATAAALVWLNSEKERSKKVGPLNYSELCIQNYLTSDNLNVKQKKILTHFRGKMIKVRANYSKMHESILCQLCLQNNINSEDTQQHLLDCTTLINNGDISNNTEYSDIFHEEPVKYENITLLLEQKLILRERSLRNIVQNIPGEPS